MDQIRCPHCAKAVPLTESLAAPLIAAARADFHQQMQQKDAEITRREEVARNFEKKLRDDKQALDDIVRAKLKDQLKNERERIAAEEAEKAKVSSSLELEIALKKATDAQEHLREMHTKLAQAQNAEAEFLKKQRELDTIKRELELNMQKKIDAERKEILEYAKKQADDSYRMNVQQKDQMISSLRTKIDELQRKAEQGSQQLQGETLEVQLESLLRQYFPTDTITAVPKGEFGGDVLQSVVSSTGQRCGVMIWEAKYTKNWSDAWLTKLRQDQRAAKADIAILVSQALPKEIKQFELIDGIWVVHLEAILAIAFVLRYTLLQTHGAKTTAEGQRTKMEIIYQYLTGSQFRQRVEAMLENVSSMKEDLTKERQVMMRQWSKRERQIDNTMEATMGMWGDLQGIAGKSLQELESLEFSSLALDGNPQSALPGLS